MSHLVLIKPSSLRLVVNEDETVLDAALREGFHFPHDCYSGICGACRGRVLEGQVCYQDAMLPSGLTSDEQAEGEALFCSAMPKTDLIIEVENVLDPLQTKLQTVSYQIMSAELLTGHVYRVMLQAMTEQPLRYRAGQYIEILCDHEMGRPFSIANAPLGEGEIELHVRYVADNPYLEEVMAAITARGQMQLRGPFGHCLYHREPALPTIFLAAGTGFAPIKAIIEQALSEGVTQPMYLYWGARTQDDLYLHELAQQWEKYIPQFHYIPVLSASLPSDHWQGRTGWVHHAALADHENFADFQVYAAGPAAMVYAAYEALQARGLKKARMYSDALLT